MPIDSRIPMMGQQVNLASIDQSAQRTNAMRNANAQQMEQNKLYQLLGGAEGQAQRMQEEAQLAGQERQAKMSERQIQSIKDTAGLIAAVAPQNPEAARGMLDTIAGLVEGNALLEQSVGAAMQAYDQGGPDALMETLQPFLAEQKTTEAPSSVREYEFYNSLPAGEKEQFLNLKRNGFKLVTGSRGDITWQNPQTGEAFQVESPESALSGAGEKARTTAAAGAQGKGEQERTQASIDQGLAAADSMPVYKRGLELLRDVSTGGIDRVRLAAKQEFGIESADEAELVAGLGKAVLSQLRTTFGAQFTEQEGARLERIEANIGKSTAGNIRLLEQALAISKRAAERGITAAEANGDFETANMIEEAMNWDISTEYGGQNQTMEAGGYQIRVIE